MKRKTAGSLDNKLTFISKRVHTYKDVIPQDSVIFNLHQDTMQSMTRSVSLTFSQKRQQLQGNSDPIEAFDGETAALKQFCFPVRSYGTCGDFPSYVPNQSIRFKKYATHVVAQHETLAGIALKYDISVEDIRRTNSFLWTSNSVWVGQVIKVPVSDDSNSETSDNFAGRKASIDMKTKRKMSAHGSNIKIGPSPTEFWTKVDSSIEESKKVTDQLKKNSPVHLPTDSNSGNTC